MEDVKPTTSFPTPAPFNWWDLLPLVEEPRRRAKAHWTPKGIIMAHPTKPVILHYPNPPNTSESKQLPSHRRVFENDGFSSAKILSVSSSGDLVFAYFPSSNGSNGGACCIWDNMQLKEFWTAEQGEAIINCWWLGEARQRVVDPSGRSVRMPPLGPAIAFQNPMALILQENFTLLLVCMPILTGKSEDPCHIITGSISTTKQKAEPKRATSMDFYSGRLCTRASLGLAYSDSTIIVATQASLLPRPCVPVPETDLTMPAATFLPHADMMDWEMFGPENTIDLCEVTITFTSDIGWDMKTTPISSIHGDHHDKFYNLLFVPKTPETNVTMSIDNDPRGTLDRYLLVESVDFGSYSGPPTTKLRTYSLLKHKNDQAKSLEWSIRLDGSRVLVDQTVLHLEPGWPGLTTERGLIAAMPRLVAMQSAAPVSQINVLRVPSLETDEEYSAIPLHGPDVPLSITLSPQGTQIVLQTLHNGMKLGFHPYPIRNDLTKASLQRDKLLNTVLAAQDAQQILRLFDNTDREIVLDIVDSACLSLDKETGGGGPGRWSLQYLQMILIIEKLYPDPASKDHPRSKSDATTDLLSLPLARSALMDSHDKETEQYDPDCFWPLSHICSWMIDFCERAVSACSDFKNQEKKIDGSQSMDIRVDPLLFALLHLDLLNSWIETLARVTQFPKFLNVPPSTNSDNKILVNKAYDDMIEESQINLPNLLEALKSISSGSFPSAVEWRRGYRTLRLEPPLIKSLSETIDRILTPEIVSLLHLDVKMAGLSLVSTEPTHQERDIITKKPLADGEWGTLGVGTSCKLCGGKTMVNFTATSSKRRWNRWETSFQRCICGGQWNSAS